ncbi:MAG: hypothetical protein A3J54_03060 [Candidatus Ryanbacteria bacterium RIFCSPHIGHO2_02_FULL_45_13b]|uniref:Uncharacterized protein n=1 Tax=Candidatus Ryanbacteria bacterium RIFCSPHIGHO2_02_FULL_45_13b TaxID=1802117 RepID=A0A1G2G6Y8_9BACT|nr:MAG: hypothetical protein A3J54_03060 [Candidatus Ryanbacteria bacterium RIFCSPHIGHO2_02_FULL_45_13b]
MREFFEFLHDIQIALWSVLVMVILVAGLEVFTYSAQHRRAWERISLYDEFAHGGSTNENVVPIAFLYGIAAYSPYEELRRAAIFGLMDSGFEHEYTILHEAGFKVFMELLSHPENAAVLIAHEEKLLTELQVNWFRGFNAKMFLIATLISVIALYAHWRRESYVMQFFPYHTWWFWVYILLALPWSLLIVWGIGMWYLRTVLLRITHKTNAYKTRQKEYEKLCSDLSLRVEETRQKWGGMFLPVYAKSNIPELKRKKKSLHCELLRLGEEVERMEKEYYATRAFLQELTVSSGCIPPALQEDAYLEWMEQFNSIVKNPYVSAVHIEDKGHMDVFTTVFPRYYGELGPLRIQLDVQGSNFDILNAHAGVNRPGSWGGGGDYCLGEFRYTVRTFLQDGKPAAALERLFEAFRASANDHDLL